MQPVASAPRQYMCDCWKFCKSVPRPASERDYNRHAPFRHGIDDFLAQFDDVQSGASAPAARQPGARQRTSGGTGRNSPGQEEDVEDDEDKEEDEDDRSRPEAEGMDVDPWPLDPPDLPPPVSPPSRGRSPSRSPVRTPQPEVHEDEDPPLNADAALEREPEYGYSEDVDVPREARRREVREAQFFIERLREATLETSGIDAQTVQRMKTPRQALANPSAHERAAFRMFLARGDASEDNYTDMRTAMVGLHPEDEKDLPSYDQVKRAVADVTGIHSLRTDMCPNTCVAFTGPFEDAEACPRCLEPRYDSWMLTQGKKVPRRQFHTYPLGPQLQAMWASPENARLMRHRSERTSAIRAQLRADPSSVEAYDDVYWGSDYRKAVHDGHIKDNDTVLMFSIDGAQLYQSKASDCWFYIWVVFDLPPECRYKKRYVLPGGVIGGPNKPKNIDSFLFPGLAHLAALQRDGLQIWDASRNITFRSDPYLLLATADGPGMAFVGGLVGHQGANGCRLYCGQRSRFKANGSTYYPVMQRPHDYHVAGSDHPDVSTRRPPPTSSSTVARYNEALATLVGSQSQTAYTRNRLRTGIAKPSIFSGLPRILPIPLCFGADLMHLVTLNLTDLIVSLLRATLPCEGSDDKALWDWAVFREKAVWDDHGRLVASSTRYLPGSFDRPPRNPAQKINSGYKAWEYLLYIYGLLPGLLRHLQQPRYYTHFCKLVSGVRLLLQRRITLKQLPIAHELLLTHADEFETLYCQRRADRMHFVRQSIHATTHMAPEAHRVGPGCLYSQWTTENYIGNITREIRQHVTPYANVSERALRRTLVNALKNSIPSLAPEDPLPRGAADLGNGYVLLRASDRSLFTVSHRLEREALLTTLQELGVQLDPRWKPSLRRWARLRLPNGQIARSAWKECVLEERGKEPRRARMVKLSNDAFVEVFYYFQYSINDATRTFAMVSEFSPPDAAIAHETYGAVLACQHRGELSRKVIAATDIVSVVAMVPLPRTQDEMTRDPQNTVFANRYFVVEKPGLDVAFISGVEQEMGPAEDDVDAE